MSSTNHIVNSYDQHIAEMRNNLIQMADYAAKLMAILKQTLVDPTQENWWPDAAAVDVEINKLDVMVEQRAIEVLSLRQPMGSDFRLAISAIKMTVIFERIGDLAKGAVRRVAENGYSFSKAETSQIKGMIDDVITMINQSGKAIQAVNIKAVKKQHDTDQEVDHVYHEIMRHCIKKMHTTDSDAEHYLQLILTIKNIERIGDYANRIVKIAYYVHSGERIFNHDLR